MITPERVEELRKWLMAIRNCMTPRLINKHDTGSFADLLTILTEYAEARPLLDAAMNYHPADGMCLALNDYITIEAEELFGAALAYRAGRTR